MNKKDVITKVAIKTGYSKKDITAVIDATAEALIEEMAKHNEINIAGFGKFGATERAAREARNPRTGESISVDAKWVPKFKAAKALKDAVANGLAAGK